MAIYQLAWGTYDSGTEYQFEAPDGASFEDFEKLCRQLMNQAAWEAIEGKVEAPINNPKNKHTSWIGYDFLVDEVAMRLEKHGYKWLHLPEFRLAHGMILDDPSDDFEPNDVLSKECLDAVVKYNLGLRDWLKKQRAERG